MSKKKFNFKSAIVHSFIIIILGLILLTATYLFMGVDMSFFTANIIKGHIFAFAVGIILVFIVEKFGGL